MRRTRLPDAAQAAPPDRADRGIGVRSVRRPAGRPIVLGPAP